VKVVDVLGIVGEDAEGIKVGGGCNCLSSPLSTEDEEDEAVVGEAGCELDETEVLIDPPAEGGGRGNPTVLARGVSWLLIRGVSLSPLSPPSSTSIPSPSPSSLSSSPLTPPPVNPIIGMWISTAAPGAPGGAPIARSSLMLMSSVPPSMKKLSSMFMFMFSVV
jgi:hypothetical protein